MPNSFPIVAATGRVNLDLGSAVMGYENGLPYTSAGAVACIVATPVVFGFWGFSGGKLAILVQETDPVTFYESAGLKFALTGQLYCNYTLPIAKYVSGWPIAANGTLCAAESDPFFAQVVQLNHYQGTNGSQVFTNSASQGNTPTASGAQAALVTISNTRARFASQTTSLRIGATGGQGWTHNSGIALYQFGNGPATVEFSIWLDSLTPAVNIHDMRGNNGNYPALCLFTSTLGAIGNFFNGVTWGTSGNGVLTAAAWNDIAWVRTDNSGGAGIGSIYVNGTRVLTAADTGNYQGNTFDIGSWVNNSAGAANCNYAEHRVTLAARYSGASYTVRTSPFPDQ